MKSIGKEHLGYTVNRSGVKLRKFIVEQCRKYKIPTGCFSSTDDDIYTPDEKLALELLEDNKELPNDLKERLLSTLEERKQMHRVTKLNISISNDEIDKFLRAKGMDPSTF